MITENDLENYLHSIPPVPENIRNCINSLEEDDLTKAAYYAKLDNALSDFLITIVNRASFGFRERVTDISQIFGILGVSQSKAILHTYLVNLLSPKKWDYFALTNKEFIEFQTRMIEGWNKILDYLHEDDKYTSSAILLAASVAISEALFRDNKDDVNLILSVKNLSYNSVLQRLTGKSLFDLASFIGKNWNIDDDVIELFKTINKIDMNSPKITKFLHLFIFYELSQPSLLRSGLNTLIDFEIDSILDIHEEFNKVIGIA